MKYRIHFEPKGAFWCIQFQRSVLGWRTVTEVKPTGDGPTHKEEIVKFETYENAESYVAERGLDKAYSRQASGYLSALWYGTAQPAQEHQAAQSYEDGRVRKLVEAVLAADRSATRLEKVSG